MKTLQNVTTTFAFRVSVLDLERFRKATFSAVRLPKTAPAETMRAFIKYYNENPLQAKKLLRKYMQ